MRIFDVTSQSERLTAGPKGVKIAGWLNEWENTLARAQELDLPFLKNHMAVYGFIRSVQELDPVWANVQLAQYNSYPRMYPYRDLDSLMPTAREVVQDFRRR